MEVEEKKVNECGLIVCSSQIDGGNVLLINVNLMSLLIKILSNQLLKMQQINIDIL